MSEIAGLQRVSQSSLPPEPPEAFRFRPPDDKLKREFAPLFQPEFRIRQRRSKLLFDKMLSGLLLIGLSPVFAILYLASRIEGWLDPDSRGPFIYYYWASSQGQVFKKYKIRQIKQAFIDPELARQGLWHAYAGEWSPQSLTRVGKLVKALYLDELPQLWNILRGDMSFVGPRPLAVHHYERDLAQGNVTRKLVKGGLVGGGQAQKGTRKLGDPESDFRYTRNVAELGPVALVMLDLKIMLECIGVVFRTRGA
jgi:lipopolysaccharide/colanic/teichoic acid biosynthesis glycosyltransferase